MFMLHLILLLKSLLLRLHDAGTSTCSFMYPAATVDCFSEAECILK